MIIIGGTQIEEIRLDRDLATLDPNTTVADLLAAEGVRIEDRTLVLNGRRAEATTPVTPGPTGNVEIDVLNRPTAAR